jgi:hypothetical protein
MQTPVSIYFLQRLSPLSINPAFISVSVFSLSSDAIWHDAILATSKSLLLKKKRIKIQRQLLTAFMINVFLTLEMSLNKTTA